MKQHKITLLVPKDMFPTVVGLIHDYVAACELVEVDDERASARRERRRYVNGKHDKGITGRDLLRKIVSDKFPHGRSEIQSIFVKHGFAEKSAGPTISVGLKQHDIKEIAPDTFVAFDVTKLLVRPVVQSEKPT